MRRMFIDTGAWDAIADREDRNHDKALQFRDEITGKCTLVTTNYILDELYTLLLLNIGYQQTVLFKKKIDILIEEHILGITWVTGDIAEEAWKIFEQYNEDKQWSFTDCTSYVVMKNLGITEVFAFDRHFEQMSFTRKP
jgi:predicted nucleic acid-binding protein